MNQFLNIKFFG